MEIKRQIEEKLSEYPIFQYAFVKPDDLTFSDRIRYVCEQECPMYGMSWACPPAVGTVDHCKAKCLSYTDVLMITTVAEVNDITDMDETLETRAPHEQITHEIKDNIEKLGLETMALSTEACAFCEKCTYPNHPCRFPDRMFPCVESHGIIITDLAEQYGLSFFNGNLVTWYSLIFFK